MVEKWHSQRGDYAVSVFYREDGKLVVQVKNEDQTFTYVRFDLTEEAMNRIPARSHEAIYKHLAQKGIEAVKRKKKVIELKDKIPRSNYSSFWDYCEKNKSLK